MRFISLEISSASYALEVEWNRSRPDFRNGAPKNQSNFNNDYKS